MPLTSVIKEYIDDDDDDDDDEDFLRQFKF